MNAQVTSSWEDILKEFFVIVCKSPIAVFAFSLSFFMGYGISFVLFDYRLHDSVKKSHYLFHVIVGLGYNALVFCIVNIKIFAKQVSIQQLIECIPVTLIISLALGFIIIVSVAIWREVRSSR